MKRTVIGPGAYRDEDGGYWARPWINRRRTWRKLEATKDAAAIKEACSRDFSAPAENFAQLADEYVKRSCPNRRLEPRPISFTKEEKSRVEKLKKYFGRYRADEITRPLLPNYAAWRMRTITRGTGERAVDKDWVTLSNVLNYGVAMNLVRENHVDRGRPRYRQSGSVVHCRDKAPASADAIHLVAQNLFDTPLDEVLAWLLLFTYFTGCRQNELLRLRLDATNANQPGYVQFSVNREPLQGFLFLARSKGGVNPWASIGPEFENMLDCFHRWHSARFPSAPWFFPARDGKTAVNRFALGRALRRLCPKLGLKHFIPHGVRSAYVTKRRSDGVSDTVIAGEIGDTTISLMQTTYGNRPPNWTGGEPLSWLPKTRPAWLVWALPDVTLSSGLKTGL